MAFDEALAARIRTALEGRNDVVEKRMFGGVTFMVRGHMSCGVVGSSLMVRVDPGQEEAFLREPGARPMDFTGRPMPGFLFVDPRGIAGAASLRKWVGRATAHAESKPRKVKAKPSPSRKRSGR
ncbi:MAG TPA: TfoX/Sxy family protein [Thermoanaerobaculia bacterium]|jgi:TfoX/Sxy family transcriptional regulator of competence genes|nr:TfoX/Sxy family protein [Thermoanaerobaculia bacterium]